MPMNQLVESMHSRWEVYGSSVFSDYTYNVLSAALLHPDNAFTSSVNWFLRAYPARPFLKVTIRYADLYTSQDITETHMLEILEGMIHDSDILAFMAQGLLFDLEYIPGDERLSYDWKVVYA